MARNIAIVIIIIAIVSLGYYLVWLRNRLWVEDAPASKAEENLIEAPEPSFSLSPSPAASASISPTPVASSSALPKASPAKTASPSAKVKK